MTFVQTQDKPSDFLCDGDKVDDKELEDENDPEDPIVSSTHNYVYPLYVRSDLVQLGEMESKKPKDNQALLWSYFEGSYADTLANGDSADNKDLHEEGDMNDDVVDYNGGTNRGYGSARPVDFFAGNHIASGHFLTPPRETSPLFG